MSIVSYIKSMIENRSPLMKFAVCAYNHISFENKFPTHKNGNVSELNFVFLKKTKFNIKGNDNQIKVLPGSRLNNCHIYISGTKNKVTIGNFCSLNDVEIWIEDDCGEVFIGDHTSFAGKTHLACIEGQKIEIGEDCMFSANITVRVGDSHSITDLSGKRINPSKSVKIGNHVWVGNTVIITKGVVIGNNSVIGTGSIVTKKFEQDNVAIAGNSAKVIKEDISWDSRRLAIE